MHAISLLHRLTSVTRVSALTDAIARSFTTGEPERPALSSMRALGRRQLSGVEVLAQSVATTAPAVSMVILPLTMLTHDRLVSGIVTILVATIAVTLIAFCVSQFTRRMRRPAVCTASRSGDPGAGRRSPPPSRCW